MTRRLILTRHAKSDWSHPGLTDFQRPLNARGRSAAPAIGRWLSRRGYRPDAALLSTAQRVRETWAALSEGFDPAPAETWSDALYLSDPETMLSELAGQSAETVILIAHNPGMASLAQLMTDEPPQRPDFEIFPTCATLVLDFPVSDWSGIEPLTGKLIDFTVPRELTD